MPEHPDQISSLPCILFNREQASFTVLSRSSTPQFIFSEWLKCHSRARNASWLEVSPRIVRKTVNYPKEFSVDSEWEGGNQSEHFTQISVNQRMRPWVCVGVFLCVCVYVCVHAWAPETVFVSTDTCKKRLKVPETSAILLEAVPLELQSCRFSNCK